MKVAKWAWYCLLFLVFVGTVVGFVFLNRYLRTSSETIGWAISLSLMTSAIALFYFTKPMKKEWKNDPRWKNALRCFFGIILGCAFFFVMRMGTQRGFDIISTISINSIVFIFIGVYSFVHNKMQLAK